MNPVLILLMVAINEAQWVAAQPVVYQPFGIWSRPVRVLLDVQPPRTRSLPTQSAIGNLAGLLVKKSGETMNGFITNKVRNNDTKSTTVTTTTEWPISVAQPTTVDIETLPGFWLKDPSRIPESTGGGVPYQMDYRTERYRLDDLLLTKKARHDDKETIFSS